MASEDAIRQIRERLDLVEVIGQYAQLKKTGRTYSGISPFRSERTPSFHVWPETQTWRDFGSNEGGDLFTFIMKIENLDFKDALTLLAERAGVTLTRAPEKKTASEEEERRERLYALNEAAALFYQNLLTCPPAGAAGPHLLSPSAASRTKSPRSSNSATRRTNGRR